MPYKSMPWKNERGAANDGGGSETRSSAKWNTARFSFGEFVEKGYCAFKRAVLE